MFFGKSKSLTNEEISFRGRIAVLMIILASGDFIDNHSGDAVFWARSLAGVKDSGKLTETEKDLAKEFAYLGVAGLANGAKKFLNDDNSINIFIGSATTTLKNNWPDHSSTKRYFSEKISSREMLYSGVIESFVKAYKDRSTVSLEELKRKADQTLVEQILSVGRQTAESILSASDKEVQTIAKNLGINLE